MKSGRVLKEIVLNMIKFSAFVGEVTSALWPLKESNKTFSDEEIKELSTSLSKFVGANVNDSFYYIIKEVLDPKNKRDAELAYSLINNPYSLGHQKMSSMYVALKQSGFQVDEFLMIVRPVVHKFISNKEGFEDQYNSTPTENEGGQPEWGKFLFAPQRRGQVPNEPNEEEENIAYLEIEDHIHNNQAISSKTIANLKKALESGSYEKILHEPKVQKVYRGIKITHEGLEKLLQQENIPDKGAAILDKMVSGRGDIEGASSWTVEFEIAKEFASKGNLSHFSNPDKKYYSLIFVANVRENPNKFITGPGGFYKVRNLNEFEETEKEVIALGPIVVHKVYWDGSKEFPEMVEESSKKSSEEYLRLLIREMLQEEMPKVTCRVCRGSGEVAGEYCATCGGEGEEIDYRVSTHKGIGRGPLPYRM